MTPEEEKFLRLRIADLEKLGQEMVAQRALMTWLNVVIDECPKLADPIRKWIADFKKKFWND